MRNDKKIFITTPIYYPNDNLHIGHVYTTVLADIYKKYKSQRGFEVYFLTGSDEHGQKIFEKAQSENKNPKEYVDKIIKNFKKLWNELGIDYDFFIRTTDKFHEQYVQKTFEELQNEKYIYKGKYEGLYCKYDEEFFTKNQIKKDNICPECNRELIFLSEESYFLKVSEFKNWILNKLKNNELLIPNHRNKELINNFLNNEFRDLSITRTSLTWGINVLNDSKHVIYVWFDALLNYLSVFENKESKYKIEDIWNEKSNWEILQFIGKEITRFHAIYWPIILKMKNYKMPKIVSHGWIINDDGQKMSKSKGNVIDPFDLINKYGSDSLRFYLINNVTFGEDGKFSEKLLVETINGILVNKYSNLIARTSKMIWKYRNGIVPNVKNNIENKLKKELDKIEEDYFKLMDSIEINKAIKKLVDYINLINLYIEKEEPWKIEDQDKLDFVLNISIKNIYKISYLLAPFLPNTFNKVNKWLNNGDFSKKINEIDYLFKRI